MRTLKGHANAVTSVGSDGNTLAAGGYSLVQLTGEGPAGVVMVWDAVTRYPRAVFAHPNWVSSVALSPDGKTLASGCKDGAVRLWNVPAPAE
jgi:WD40 repeat protein